MIAVEVVGYSLGVVAIHFHWTFVCIANGDDTEGIEVCGNIQDVAEVDLSISVGIDLHP